MNGLVIDNFAGGGGASTGIEQALGRAVDIAINHDEAAIRMHEANHPGTRHIRKNIWRIDPADVCGGRHVELAWFSPDCKHFSKAKGGKPREKSIRDLAWVVVLWGKRVRPDVILLENVEEFRTWGPLDEAGQPIKERAGETFDKWCRELRKLGYQLQFRELRACDYGAPTIRKRFFMVARRDGLPIIWPQPSHGHPESAEVQAGQRKPWRTAAEIIDWSRPCPSIFERKKPLAEKTLRRIAHGIVKFVLNNPRPFIVPITHGGGESRSHAGDEPLRTVTGAQRGELAVVCPHVTKFREGAVGHAIDEPLHTITANSFIKRPGGAAPLGIVEATVAPFFARTAHGDVDSKGKRRGKGQHTAEEPFPTISTSQDSAVVQAFMQKFADNGKGYDPDEPLHTVMAGAPRHAVVAAHLAQYNNHRSEVPHDGRDLEEPLSTVTTTGMHQALVTSNLVKLRGSCQHGQLVDAPLATVSAQGTHIAEVRAFLLKYYGTGAIGSEASEPLHTVTDKARFGLVTVTIDGEDYVIVDIGMRMLTPRELFNAQGFPPDYIIDHDAQGNPTTKTSQVARCGNSVCPPLARALVGANVPSAIAADAESEAA
jgi:DNA (cytosine-5)-methyltransferase 1